MDNKEVIEQRTPIWMKLSELYLDTELQGDDYKNIAEVFYRSPYTLSEIYLINRHEVSPILITNLFSVAGEWAGFDEAWLVKSITEKTRDFNKIKTKKFTFTSLYFRIFGSSDWKKIYSLYNAFEK